MTTTLSEIIGLGNQSHSTPLFSGSSLTRWLGSFGQIRIEHQRNKSNHPRKMLRSLTNMRGVVALTGKTSTRMMATTPTLMSDVHGTTHGKKHWRNKPLFRREGDKKFRNGQEAADMLCVVMEMDGISMI